MSGEKKKKTYRINTIVDAHQSKIAYKAISKQFEARQYTVTKIA